MVFLTPFTYYKRAADSSEIFVEDSLTSASDYVDIQQMFKQYFPNYRPGRSMFDDATLEDIEAADKDFFDVEDVSDVAERDLADISEYVSENLAKARAASKDKDDNKKVLKEADAPAKADAPEQNPQKADSEAV